MNYGTLAAADAYHADRGNSTWTGTDEAKNIALLRGSEYVDQNFRSSFPGFKAGLREQVREWPRTFAHDIEGLTIPSDQVPVEVENATYEAALRELVTPGSLFPDFTPGQQQKRVKVGPIEVENTGPLGVRSVKPILTIVQGILQPILTGRANSSLAGRTARG